MNGNAYLCAVEPVAMAQRCPPIVPVNMPRILARSAALAATLVSSAAAQPTTDLKTTDLKTADLKARCDQLIRYFDRYGSSRNGNSDGVRNMTRIAARLDCDDGLYEAGIAAMEDLLRRKKFSVPPPAAK